MGAQRADPAGFAEQPVPGVTATVDDVFGGAKDTVRQAIVAQMQPQPLDRIKFGRVGRQKDQAEVVGHNQIAGGMPTRLVHQYHAMRPGAHGLGQLGKEQVHRRGIEPGQHQRHPGVARRAHSADDPGRLIHIPSISAYQSDLIKWIEETENDYYGRITAGQLADSLSAMYNDYSNRQIGVIDAVEVAVESIRGADGRIYSNAAASSTQTCEIITCAPIGR